MFKGTLQITVGEKTVVISIDKRKDCITLSNEPTLAQALENDAQVNVSTLAARRSMHERRDDSPENINAVLLWTEKTEESTTIELLLVHYCQNPDKMMELHEFSAKVNADGQSLTRVLRKIRTQGFDVSLDIARKFYDTVLS